MIWQVSNTIIYIKLVMVNNTYNMKNLPKLIVYFYTGFNGYIKIKKII